MTQQNSENRLEQLASKLNEVLVGFRLNLSNLRENIETLDSNPVLKSNINLLADDAKLKAFNLELEVKQLRQDLNAIREFLQKESIERNQEKGEE